MLFLLQDPGGGGGGDQGTNGRGLAADEPVFYHIALAVDADHFLVAILAGRGPATDNAFHNLFELTVKLTLYCLLEV